MNRFLVALLICVPLTLGAQEADAGRDAGLREAKLNSMRMAREDEAIRRHRVAEQTAQTDEAGQRAREARLREAELRLEQAARDIAELSSQIAGESMQHVFETVHRGEHQGRAMLGINVGRLQIERDDGTVEESGVHADGVEIFGVTPGGPAAEAGLESGDVILALDDKPLAGQALSGEETLMQLMSEIEPGAIVRVTFRRDDRERSVDVLTRAFEPMAFAFGSPGQTFRFEVDGEEVVDLPEVFGRFPGFGHLGRHDVWRGLELVPLTPKLGSYFGTDTGLLVVRAPRGDAIPLEEGDVIVAIAGATPRSPPEAMRLLRFYQPGDQVVVDVLRQQRSRTFKVTIPESAD